MKTILEQTYEAWNKGIIEFEDYLRQIIVLNSALKGCSHSLDGNAKRKQEEEAEKKAFMDDLEERL